MQHFLERQHSVAGRMDADPARLEEWLQHRDWVAALARSLVMDSGTADDLVQETWIAAVSKGPRREGLSRPWLSRVLRNFAMQRFRSESKRKLRELGVPSPEDWPSAEEIVERVEIQRQLAEAVLRLPASYRETVVLRYFEGKTSAEIARRTATPESTVRSRLARGLETLRRDLDSGHGGDRRAWILALKPFTLASPRFVQPASVSSPAPALQTIGGVTLAKTAWNAALIASVVLLLGIGAWWTLPRLSGSSVSSEGQRLATLPDQRGVGDESKPPKLDEQHDSSGERRAANGPIPSSPNQALLVARIVGPGRHPVAGAYMRPLNRSGVASATSDSDGRVQLTLPRAGADGKEDEENWIELEVGCPPFARTHIGLRAPIGRTTYLGEIPMQAGGWIRGQVVDESGQGRADVSILLEDLSHSSLHHVGLKQINASILPLMWLGKAEQQRSGSGGSFDFSCLAPGPFRLWAIDPAAFPACSTVVWVAAGETTTVEPLQVQRPEVRQVIRGLVLDSKDNPVAGADIRTTDPTVFEEHAIADDRGHFTLILPADNSGTRTLVVRDGRSPPREAKVADVSPGGEELRIRIAERPRLNLFVHEADGKPIERFGLNIARNGSDVESYRTSLRTGGTYALPVPPWSFGLLVYAPGHQLTQLGPFDPEKLPTSLDCSLPIGPGVRGRVLVHGKPVRAAKVSLTQMLSEGEYRTIREVDAAPVPLVSRVMGLHPLESTETDADGRFFVGVLTDKSGLLRVEADGYAPWLQWSVREPSDDLKVNLTKGGAIEGQVTLPESEDASGILVGATCGDEHVLTQRTDPVGHYRFDHLTPGGWQVRLLAREQTPTELAGTVMDWGSPRVEVVTDCEVAEGETCRHDFKGGGVNRPHLRGHISVDGIAPSGWTVRLIWASTLQDRYSTTIDRRGRFDLDVAEPGRYFLQVGGQGRDNTYLCVRQELDLVGPTKDWSFDLATATLKGEKKTILSEEQYYLSAVRLDPGPILCTATLKLQPDLSIAPSAIPAGATRILGIDLGASFDWSRIAAERALMSIDAAQGTTVEVTIP